jgi:hypothetical protein
MKKAIQMDPGCHEAFFHLGLAFLEQNWKKKAKECFQTALNLNPRELHYKNALELLKNESRSGSKVGLTVIPAINEESMEVLVKDELRLNFRPNEVELRFTGEGVESK